MASPLNATLTNEQLAQGGADSVPPNIDALSANRWASRAEGNHIGENAFRRFVPNT